MKRTVIGGILMLCGLLLTCTIILAATIHIVANKGWGDSEIWFAIFGDEQLEDNYLIGSLNLGVPFVLGIILSSAGFALLVLEYFNTSFIKLFYIIKKSLSPERI